jgi:hypothetical protein
MLRRAMAAPYEFRGKPPTFQAVSAVAFQFGRTRAYHLSTVCAPLFRLTQREARVEQAFQVLIPSREQINCGKTLAQMIETNPHKAQLENEGKRWNNCVNSVCRCRAASGKLIYCLGKFQTTREFPAFPIE